MKKSVIMYCIKLFAVLMTVFFLLLLWSLLSRLLTEYKEISDKKIKIRMAELQEQAANLKDGESEYYIVIRHDNNYYQIYKDSQKNFTYEVTLAGDAGGLLYQDGVLMFHDKLLNRKIKCNISFDFSDIENQIIHIEEAFFTVINEISPDKGRNYGTFITMEYETQTIEAAFGNIDVKDVSLAFSYNKSYISYYFEGTDFCGLDRIYLERCFSREALYYLNGYDADADEHEFVDKAQMPLDILNIIFEHCSCQAS